MEQAMALSVVCKFRGLYDTRNSKPDLQGLASRFVFIRPRAENRVRYTTAEYVIKDEARFGEFVDRVPDHDDGMCTESQTKQRSYPPATGDRLRGEHGAGDRLS